MSHINDTITALATPPGQGALGIIRVSGSQTIPIVNDLFKGKDLTKVVTHTIHLGTIRNDENEIIDEVLVSIFKGPNSYTKEDVIEISSHGSQYILQKILSLLVSKGARLAKPGEFTQKAFLNGRFDLAQAEAVADLIASENASMQQTAMKQMRGGFSDEIKNLREQLVHFASMIELELDFAEEDVEFADRQGLIDLVNKIQTLIQSLISSFEYGNAIKNGIPTVIAGKPNAGKSTLLNALLNEEKAIVSDVAGTTRDFIEDSIYLDGIAFRFIDTAGIRETEDKVESIGVQRTLAKMKEASLVIYMIDLANDTTDNIREQIEGLKKSSVPSLIVGNKVDEAKPELKALLEDENAVFISAKGKDHLDDLKAQLQTFVTDTKSSSDVIVTNARHLQSLQQTDDALNRVIEGINMEMSNDLVAQDIRSALFHLGEITGEVTTDDLLENIFSKFCIGK
ncbi:tRNA modification GTPase trmE [Ekhidna lutea]|uniref:tRNA modification GTPase MnmE n=1 Tax=Ekhidna lutea TaxID=447679 RepID=A0A239GPA8_EKHLU|nr:tRNA uridine-5-carboxymethylaminomethyl(34) synthesis GTPase MnmE [Ekhidna lutea]SNS70705.1 tRNA modification GTPase trmE [Ekhidna lutea]